MLASEIFHTPLVGTIVDEVVAVTEVLVVCEDDAFVERGMFVATEVLLHPVELVAPGGGVVPRGGGEDVEIVAFAELLHGLHRARHRIHQREDTRYVVLEPFESRFRFFHPVLSKPD